ncbi:MAG: hypothetical protein KGI50_06320, partial [Patescibacteria group bacterium]|nr:hypothetical protein [Patescibacteria group bacterium]
MLSTPLNHLTDRELHGLAESQLDEFTSRDSEIELVKRFGALLGAHEDNAEHLGDYTVAELADGNAELNKLDEKLEAHGLDRDDLESLLDYIKPHYVGQGT